ncbi:FG-GAP-like repeat-containing protein [Streptomyces sp. CB01373]|uniref:FG-GAP-like repeat-containing protein n=2 Tax=unclassified Streptomyces TaxID=2593676 RepID=UPI000C272926|nr:FG-GAP-like repeat-containing protein [Streptomyces sp. CB01373]PJM95122.1 esterase [Streptomyces sp. CB01373]
MRRLSVRRAPAIGLLAAALAVGTCAAPSAQAVTGPAAPDAGYGYTAHLDIGAGTRACSGTLVDPEWLLTAASCFVDNPAAGIDVPAGPPQLPTVATIGRTDLTTAKGQVRQVVELVPRTDRDLVMAKLAQPVTDVAPVTVASTAPSTGETLLAGGFGRTADAWVPDRLHTASFTVDSVEADSVSLAGTDGAICMGDTGGPALRVTDGTSELVAVNSRSWQGGCFGSTESRTGAVDTRVDDLNEWVQQVRALPRASQVVSGDFNGDGREDVAVFYDNGTSPEGKNRCSLHVFYSTGTGFAEPKKVWSTPGGFTFASSKLTAGDYNGDGKDDIAVFYNGGKSDDGKNISSLYTFTSTGTGFSNPRKTWTNSGFTWSASQVTSGDFNGDGKDDVAVLYNGGTADDGKSITSLYTFTSTGTEFSNPRKTWTSSGSFTWSRSKLTSGDFNGDGKDDVAVLYDGGTSDDGKNISSLYTFTSTGTEFNNPRKTWTSSGSFTWSRSKLTSGDFNGDRKDDVAVLYDRGTADDGKAASSLFTFTSNGTDLAAPREVWTSTGSFNWNASQLTAGDYDKDGKCDVGVLYDAGKTPDGRLINSLFTFTSTGTGIKSPVKHWSGSVI